MTSATVDATRYTYRVTWSLEDEEFVATCLELPLLSCLAPTQEEALSGLRGLVADEAPECGECPSPDRP